MSPDIVPGGIDAYIARSPEALRDALNAMRLAIREAAPDALETLSYFQIPGFYYEGYDYHGLFAWFSFKGSFVRLHVRPPVLDERKAELAGYATTKAIISFPAATPLPLGLVKDLVRASVTLMKNKR